mmetsp:Transcript_43567/g.76295  ORF Transcript_43567/g.76295 Transcript_43567/m.76295 type:complete len:210 (+) Transcript_43567:549-1178(+)
MHGILDQINHVCEIADPKVYGVQCLPKILAVIKCQVITVDAYPLGIVDVTAERVREEVELEAETQQGPVLSCKICKQWHALAHIAYVFQAKDIKIVCVLILHLDLHLSILVILLLLVFFCCLLLSLRSSLSFRRIFEFILLLLPSVQLLAPLHNLAMEPRRWLDVIDTSCDFALKQPFSQQLTTCGLLLPLESDFVKSLLLVRQTEACE